MNLTTASFEKEAALLRALFDIVGPPYQCCHCRQELAPETGWKPRISSHHREELRTDTLIVELFCGPCVRAGRTKDAPQFGQRVTVMPK